MNRYGPSLGGLTGRMAIFANPDGGRTIVFRFDIHSAIPVSRVPMPGRSRSHRLSRTARRPDSVPGLGLPHCGHDVSVELHKAIAACCPGDHRPGEERHMAAEDYGLARRM